VDRATFLAKAQALQERLSFFVDRRYTDPQDLTPFFEAWLPMRETLRKEDAELFGDLPQMLMPKSSGTTDNNGRGYFEDREVGTLYQDITYCVRVLSALPKPESGGSAIAVTREGVFFAGQYFDALQRLSDLVRSSKKDVYLIDGFVDPGVLKVLTARADGARVRILTRKGREAPSLEAAAIAFNKQYGGLEVRLSDEFHDRFLFLDDTEAYHLGASIKDAGHRGFMFSKIEEPSVVDPLRKRADDVWGAADKMV
jgi:hypothetical protein